MRCQHKCLACTVQVFHLPPERIWVSVYEKDDEAFALWRDQVKVPEDRIVRMGAADNFWAAGTTGKPEQAHAKQHYKACDKKVCMTGLIKA